MELNYHGEKVDIDLDFMEGEKEFDTNNDDTDLEDTIEIPIVKDEDDVDEI